MPNGKEEKEAKHKKAESFVANILVSRGMSEKEAKEAAGEIVTKGWCIATGAVPVG